MATNPTRLVPIRTVCATYNLNPNTLRTWERRYGIITPRRSDGGHRGYGEQDLANIEQMLHFMASGLSPAEAAARIRHSDPAPAPAPAICRIAGLREQFRASVQAMDQLGTLAAARHAVSDLGYKGAVESVLFPELAYWGDRWDSVQSGIAHEHVATLAIQTILHERLQEALTEACGVPVVLACAPGEQHILPILHVANLLCPTLLVKPVLLVGGLPISQILEISAQTGARAMIISATITPRPDIVREWVAEIVRTGWEDSTILVGGGFTRSRIFSETRVKSAPGTYDQVQKVLRRLFDQENGKPGRSRP